MFSYREIANITISLLNVINILKSVKTLRRLGVTKQPNGLPSTFALIKLEIYLQTDVGISWLYFYDYLLIR